MTINMINSIAGMLYATYAHNATPVRVDDTPPTWDQYAAANPIEADAWRKVAEDTPGILAAAGITSVQSQVDAVGKTSGGVKSVIYAVIAAALGAVAGLLSGCGHDVTVTPDYAEVCRDGACLVADKITGTITYTQHAPTPDEMAPIVTAARGDK